MAHGARETDQAMPTLSRELHAAVHADAPAPAGPPPVLVLASPAPIPLEVIITWLRKSSARGVPIRISPLLAQRIAAELAQR